MFKDYAEFSFRDNENNRQTINVYAADVYQWEFDFIPIIDGHAVPHTDTEILNYIAKRMKENANENDLFIIEQALEKEDFREWLINRWNEETGNGKGY